MAEVPGCIAHGDMQVTTERNIKDAVQLWTERAGARYSDPGGVPLGEERELRVAAADPPPEQPDRAGGHFGPRS